MSTVISTQPSPFAVTVSPVLVQLVQQTLACLGAAVSLSGHCPHPRPQAISWTVRA